MVFIVSFLRRFSFRNRNGNVVEVAPSKQESGVVGVSQNSAFGLAKFDVHKTETPEFITLERIEGLKELMESQIGVAKAQVSLKKAKDGTQSLQILIICTSRRKIRRGQGEKLIRRLTRELIPRTYMMPQERIFIKVRRAPKKATSTL